MKYIFNSTGHSLLFDNIIAGDNCSLFTAEGERYLDLESGIWCTSLGHCHPRITQILAEQSGKLVHSGYCYLGSDMDIAGGRMLEITGISSGKCVFLSSGSEAVEFAVKLAQHVVNKPLLLTMRNCYLSAYGTAGERSPEHWIHFDWQNEDHLERIDFTKIAAFVFEPGSSLGLVHFPPVALIQRIVQQVQQHGGIVIANEVTTGMGRTGRWFGYNHYDIVPDMVAAGKGLGNGYPVSCTVISDAVIDKVDVETFHYGQSHQNDPLGAAVASAVIETIKQEQLLERASLLGAEIHERLDGLKRKYCKIVKEVRARGLMFAIEFERHHPFSIADEVFRRLLAKKIIVVKRPGVEVLRIDPALTIPRTDVEYFLETLESIIAGISAINAFPNDGSTKADEVQ